MLARTLPRLLREAQAADAAYSGSDDGARPPRTCSAQLYQIASSALRKLGEYELAWLAADRSIAVSQRAGDQLLAGTATYRVGNALLALGRARPALEVNVNIANRLAPAPSGESDEARLSVYGMLLLQGAMAAARIGDSATVRDLLLGAEEAADQVGEDANHYWTCFGPTNVKLHRGRGRGRAGRGADRPSRSTRPSTRQHFAALHAGAAGPALHRPGPRAGPGRRHRPGQRDAAEGDRLAPSEIRCRPIAQEVLADVLRRTRGTPSPVSPNSRENMGVGL